MDDKNDNSRTLQSYQDKTQKYIEGTPPPNDEVREWIDKALKRIPKEGKVLEVGSGFGRDAEYIKSRGYVLECSDAVSNFVELLQKKGFQTYSLDLLKDEIDGKYNMVFANGVLLHFTPEEFKVVVKKIHAALQSGGIFAFSLKKGSGGAWTDEKLGAPRYFCYWQLEDLKITMNEYGFEWIDSAESHTSHNKADWMRIICKKSKK